MVRGQPIVAIEEQTIDEDDDMGFKPHLVETEEEWSDEED
jgi:hypothetical protein